ncbi:MAG: hypothetical protein R3E93_14705, partial [Thiothrix sp.]
LPTVANEQVSIHSRLKKPGESWGRLEDYDRRACFNPLPTKKAGRISALQMNRRVNDVSIHSRLKKPGESPSCKGIKVKKILRRLREPARQEIISWFAAKEHYFTPSKINGLKTREPTRKFGMATGSRLLSTLGIIPQFLVN